MRTSRNIDIMDRPETNAPSSRAFNLETYPFYLMARTSGLYNAILAENLKAIGMDQPRWRVLMLLKNKNPANMGYLADHAVIKQSTLTRIIKSMESQDLVRSRPGERDARITDVFITERGGKALSKIVKRLDEVYARAIEGLNPADIDLLCSVLKHMERNLLDSEFEASEPTEVIGNLKLE